MFKTSFKKDAAPIYLEDVTIDFENKTCITYYNYKISPASYQAFDVLLGISWRFIGPSRTVAYDHYALTFGRERCLLGLPRSENVCQFLLVPWPFTAVVAVVL